MTIALVSTEAMANTVEAVEAVRLRSGSRINSGELRSQKLRHDQNSAAGTQDKIRIEKLEIDKSELSRPCRPGLRGEANSCNDSLFVRAVATISGASIENVRFNTSVSGGQIVKSTGPEFIWDLSSADAGRYTLSVCVIDKEEKGRCSNPKSVEASVVECSSCRGGDYCASLKVSGPAGLISPGQLAVFTAETNENSSEGGTTFNWTVSAGTITSGQGTPQIKVAVDQSLAGSNITATVNTSNPKWTMPCPTSDTATVGVADMAMPVARMIDEFRTSGDNCEDGFARMDSLLNELNNEPNAMSLVTVYGDDQENHAAERRLKQLKYHLQFRSFDPERVEFIRGRSTGNGTTQLWVIPAGAERPLVIPAVESAKHAQTVKTGSAPYLHGAEYADGIPGCNNFDLDTYAEILKTQPSARGRIVIGESSQVRYRRKLADVLTALKTKGVVQGRITGIYKPVRAMQAEELIELWIVPRRVPRKRR
ncbi:MAG: hypothetical protein WKF92_16330 [Pyrinomonadaceae bacterium]